MPKYLVRCDVSYSSVIEAEDEKQAIDKAPAPPKSDDWDQTSDMAWTAEEEEQ